MVTESSLSQGVNPKTSKQSKLLYTCVCGHMYLHTQIYLYPQQMTYSIAGLCPAMGSCVFLNYCWVFSQFSQLYWLLFQSWILLQSCLMPYQKENLCINKEVPKIHIAPCISFKWVAFHWIMLLHYTEIQVITPNLPLPRYSTTSLPDNSPLHSSHLLLRWLPFTPSSLHFFCSDFFKIHCLKGNKRTPEVNTKLIHPMAFPMGHSRQA